MLRGYFRRVKGWSVNKQKAALTAAGVAPKAMYSEDELQDAIRSLRAGDVLVVSGLLRALGDSRRAIQAAIEAVKAQGATVMEAETGRKAGSDDGVTLLAETLNRIHGERAMPTADRARELQRKGVANRTKGRMAQTEAIKFWRDATLSQEDALAKMTGWTMVTAYRQLGPRGLPAGRKPGDFKRKMAFKQQREKETGAVYFCRASGRGPVKIGYAANVQARIKDLQVSNHGDLAVITFIEGTKQDETALHKRFAKYRVRGEWFKYEGALKRYILSLPKLPK